MIDQHLNAFSVAFFGVSMVLFLTFFVTTPTVCGLGPNVHLPWAATASMLNSTEQDLSILLTRDRSFFVGSALVSASRLSPELLQIAGRTPDRSVVLSADATVPYGLVKNAIAAVRDAGFSKVYVVTFRGTPREAWNRSRAS